eukprot:6189670-Pleurochrysis_carterae.AAC.3
MVLFTTLGRRTALVFAPITTFVRVGRPRATTASASSELLKGRLDLKRQQGYPRHWWNHD